VSGPADPFLETGDAVTDTLAIGRPLVDGVQDGLFSRGLVGLYEAVLGMGRGDLEAAVLTLAHDLLEDAEADRLRRREPGEEIPRGYRLLAEVCGGFFPERPDDPGGWEGVLAEARARPSPELCADRDA